MKQGEGDTAMIYYTTIDDLPVPTVLVGDEDGLMHLHMIVDQPKRTFELAPEWQRNDIFFASIKEQLQEYFGGVRRRFDIQINPQGTDFQKQVWRALLDVSYGTTASYKDIAIRLGNPNASRAIGMANSKNPLPIIVPCHRIVGSRGGLTGFAYGVEVKRNLLRIEGHLRPKGLWDKEVLMAKK